MSDGKQSRAFRGEHLEGHAVPINGDEILGYKLFIESESFLKWIYSVDSRQIPLTQYSTVPHLLYEQNVHLIYRKAGCWQQYIVY